MEVVPLLHVCFGDRCGCGCWARLAESCYTFASLGWIARDLEQKLALAREMETNVRSKRLRLEAPPASTAPGGGVSGAIEWMVQAEEADRLSFSSVVGMCFGIVPARMELVEHASDRRNVITSLGRLWKQHALVTDSNLKLASARKMCGARRPVDSHQKITLWRTRPSCSRPDIVGAMGLRNSTCILGVIYFERFERALGEDARTLACLDWRVRYRATHLSDDVWTLFKARPRKMDGFFFRTPSIAKHSC